MEKKKYYYTYVVLCTEGSLKGKIYFGQHSTNNLNDKYKCSSKIIKDYLKKYPNGYIRQILSFYNSKEELDKAEYDLIHPHLNKEYCLNQRDGGFQPVLGENTKEKISISLKKYFESEENRKKAGIHNIGNNYTKGRISPLRGIKKPLETRNKMSEAQRNKPKSKEHKKHLSEALMGTKRTLESRKKQSETLKGHKCYILGTHRVYDNPEHTKWHMEKD